MNKSLALIPVAFAIFALILFPAVMSVSADPDKSNGKGSDNTHPNQCGNSNGKAAQKNPNCQDDCDESNAPIWYYDSDGDGHGTNSDTKQQCDKPAGNYVLLGDDCDDGDPLLWDDCP